MTAVLCFELPWPAPALHPNSRSHRMAYAKSAAKARLDAAMVCRSAMVVMPFEPPKGCRFRIDLDFYPTTTRNRDKDNCQHAMKASLDGIADALKVNDVRFDPVTNLHPAKKGRQESVMVTVTAIEHPVDALLRAGAPLSAEAEREARALCDELVEVPA